MAGPRAIGSVYRSCTVDGHATSVRGEGSTSIGAGVSGYVIPRPLPSFPRRREGSGAHLKLDKEVWKRYESRREALAADASAIREGRELPAVPSVGLARAQMAAVTIEAQHVERFQFSVPDKVIEATRSEQSLVLAFTAHLESQGHMVTRHRARPAGAGVSIVCDLVDETDHVLYEAKGNVERPSVRVAIGQLLDYRRFESTPPRLAVLLPQEPARDIIELIHSVPASVVWRTKDGFDRAEPSATSA